ncbi:hypothetical protein JCM24511_02107 [Saitozyma sp. JCM 24511]|nr:hypothetical protein JCM24511_02107 [Saitozyma sp. JCM 24511]
MTTPQHEDKLEAYHVEDVDAEDHDVISKQVIDNVNDPQRLAALEGRGILKSRWDELSISKTLRVFRRAALYCFLSYTLNMLDGWQIGIAGSIIVNAGFVKQFGTNQGDGVLALDTTWVSAWGAIINVGQFVAITYIPFVANRFGRKAAFYACWAAFVILAGKLFVGVAAGSAQLTTTPYVVEIAPNRIRGGLGTFQAVWSSIGSIVCSAMLQVANEKYPNLYLLPIYVLWGLSAIMLGSILVLPESPWYYARHNNKEACMRSMRRLYGDVKEYDYEEEYNIILRTLEHERKEIELQKAAHWGDIVSSYNLKRTLIITIYFVGELLGGLALVSTYSTYFFEIAGLTDPFLGSLIVSIINLVSILTFALVVDKIGRRRPVTISYTFTSLSLWLIGALYYVDGHAAQIVLLVLCCVWSGAFTIMSNIYWVMAAELPSAHLRIKTGSFSLFFAACFGIITCFAVPPMLVALNLRAGFIFGATSLPICIFFWYFLPETKGRAAAEIDELFERRIPAWRWGRTTTIVEEQMRNAVQADRAVFAE